TCDRSSTMLLWPPELRSTNSAFILGAESPSSTSTCGCTVTYFSCLSIVNFIRNIFFVMVLWNLYFHWCFFAFRGDGTRVRARLPQVHLLFPFDQLPKRDCRIFYYPLRRVPCFGIHKSLTRDLFKKLYIPFSNR